MTIYMGDTGPTTWLAGWNMPGYMPEMEPIRTMDWDEAAEFLPRRTVRRDRALLLRTRS